MNYSTKVESVSIKLYKFYYTIKERIFSIILYFIVEKCLLKNNMMEVYNITPPSANTFTETFSNNIFYGRLRANYFHWDWNRVNYLDDVALNRDHKALGIGIKQHHLQVSVPQLDFITQIALLQECAWTMMTSVLLKQEKIHSAVIMLKREANGLWLF